MAVVNLDPALSWSGMQTDINSFLEFQVWRSFKGKAAQNGDNVMLILQLGADE